MFEIKRNREVSRWGRFTFIYRATGKGKIEVKVLSLGKIAIQKKRVIKKREDHDR